MLTRLTAIVFVFCSVSAAQAGAIIELIPDNPGPYFGGESLTVDVWLNSETAFDIGLRRMQFDFSESHAALSLGSMFAFDFSSLPNDSGYQAFLFPELPVPWTAMSLDCYCPSMFLVLPFDGSLRVGSISVQLPTVPGIYEMDTLNADDPADAFGARIIALPWPELGPTLYWSAFDGDLTGGAYHFEVVPEPTVLLLVIVGAMGMTAGVRRRGLRRDLTAILIFGIFVALDTAVMAQPAAIPSDTVVVGIDSGTVMAPEAGGDPVVVFSHVVSAPEASWIRLHFAEVTLSGSATAGTESAVRITSLLDGAVQTLGSSALGQWRNTSAYFNGDAVLVELLVHANTGTNRVVIDKIIAGRQGDGQPEGGTSETGMDCLADDRIVSTDPSTGRLLFAVPAGESGCTAFLFNERPNSLLTAGHCCSDIDWQNIEFPPIVEFRVPISNGDGSINRPGPEHQYSVDEDSVQFQYLQPGDDWCYFGVFDNTETHLSPLEAQGSSLRLADQATAADGSSLRIFAYGQDLSTPEHNLIQQTDAGPYEALEGTRIGYGVYTTLGVSGAPVRSSCRRMVYGIHTNGGCFFPHWMNFGTAIHHAGLQAALANPQGVCAQPLDCNDNGIDDACDIVCGPPGGACDVPGCGTSADCTLDGVPDECEPDCDRNGVADSCDIDLGTLVDANSNGVPDQCEPSIFVDAAAPAGGDGLTWDTAYNDLQDALSGQPEPCGYPVKRIWVAADTYTPDRGTENREDQFSNFGSVDAAMYGGFVRGQARFDQRDPATNVTTLSGDLLGDDGPGFTNYGDNSYTIVGLNSTILLLDGFTITGGNANGAGGFGYGGGFVAAGFFASTTVANCVLRANRATGAGGGGFLLTGASPEFINCVVSGNHTDSHGGGIALDVADPLFTNCTFSENTAGGSGGAVYSTSSITLTNSILWGNSDSGGVDESAQLHKAGGSVSIDYSCVQGWTGDLGGTGNIGDDPQFVDADGPDGIPGTVDDDLGLSAGSACIDTGDNVVVTVATDLGNNPRILYGGVGDFVDMGAYEFFGDCNMNDVPDSCDINCLSIGCDIFAATCGDSSDANSNDIPDECESASIIGARSCRNHGGDEYCHELDQDNIEPRLHAGQDNTLKFDVDLPVEVVGASVNCDISGDIGQVTASVTAEGLVQVEILDDLPNDQECCTITLTGDVEDTFELRPLRGDVNFSGIVNATDKNLVKGKIGHPIDQGDNFIYDVNMSGTINATDKNLVKGWIGGNAGTCPGGGRGAGIGVDPLPAGIADGAPQTDGPGISALAGTQLELRPVDGSGEVTALTPYTTYEVHYDSDLDAVSDYILFAVATAPGQGLSAASAPSAGDWSATGQFTFIDFVDDWDAPISAPGYPAGYWRYQMVTDEAGPTGVPGSQGHLCSITTEGPGQFDLHLYLAWTDPATQVVVETQTQAAYTVASPGGGTGG